MSRLPNLLSYVAGEWLCDVEVDLAAFVEQCLIAAAIDGVDVDGLGEGCGVTGSVVDRDGVVAIDIVANVPGRTPLDT